jgi:hypothetical protein
MALDRLSCDADGAGRDRPNVRVLRVRPHDCRLSRDDNFVERLVSGDPFTASDEDNDWFGKGVYFWEYAPKQAMWWAKDYKGFEQPAVVAARIRLGNCFDLLDPRNVRVLRAFKDELVEVLTAFGAPVPKNVRQHRALDCAVFNYIYELSDESPTPIESARGVYVPTSTARRVWRGSWISEEAHVQVCVRESKNILAVWQVRPERGSS